MSLYIFKFSRIRKLAIAKLAFTLTLSLSLFTACGKNPQLTTLAQMVVTDPPKTVSIDIHNYCPQAQSRYSTLFVANESYQLQKNKLEMDEDWDGVPNIEDNNNALAIRYDRRDSNNDGYSDLLMYLSGITSATQLGLRHCNDFTADKDQDGLTDCEEQYLVFSDEDKFDSDGDMIPDLLELRRGLNPRDSADALLDPDNDGLSNIEEIGRGTPVNVTNNEFISFYSTQVLVRPSLSQASCYDVEIKNLPVVDTVRGNLIRFYFIEEQLVLNGGGAKVFLLQNKVLPVSMRGVIDRSVTSGTKFEFEYAQLGNGATIN